MLRIGIIGTGFMGRGHIGSIAAVADEEVAALADRSEAQLKQGLESLGSEVPTHTDYRRLLDSPDVDAVVIALPSTRMLAATDAGVYFSPAYQLVT